MEEKCLIKTSALTVEYPVSRKRKLHAVSGVDLQIRCHEVMALVGESGCGKSTLGRAMIQLIKPTSGSVLFEDAELTGMTKKEFMPYRRRMQMIFQDPYASLDPRMSVRDIIAEPLETHRICATKEETTERVLELLKAVGLDEQHLYRYAHQFSGGQRQRIGIARAIALHPDFIVCDEPVSALDVSVQNQILNLLKDLRKDFGLTYLFISHDLSVVRFIADRVCVMFLGKVCEMGDTETVYSRPLHPYTRFLLEAIPRADPQRRRENLMLLSGELPSPMDPPSGCRFRTRCPHAGPRCAAVEPRLCEVEGRQVACHLYSAEGV